MEEDLNELNTRLGNYIIESDDDDDFDEEVVLEDYSDDEGDEDDDDLTQTQGTGWVFQIIQPERPAFVDKERLNEEELAHCTTPLEYFQLFFTGDMVDLIVAESNRYGRKKYNDFEDIQPQDVGIIMGIIIKMGYVHLPKMENYWSDDKALTGHSIFGEVMSRKRFMQIMRSLHFEDNDNNSGSRLYKIERYLKMFVDQCQLMQIPGEDICIDESLIPFRGRLSFRQYIPNKRHRYGIKLFKLCSAGDYTHNIEVYTGKDDTRTGSVAESVVMKLSEGLLDSWRTLYVDNWYSSVSLAETMLSRSTNLVGTLRRNMKGNPAEVVERKLKRDEMICQQKNGISILKWKDKRDVIMISTKHDDSRGRSGKPVAILDYNKSKGFIDLSDQMGSYFPFQRKTFRWYMRIFFHIMCQSAITNAWILMKNHRQTTIPIIEFKKEIVRELLSVTPPRVYRNPVLKPVEGPGRVQKGRCVSCCSLLSKEHGATMARKRASQVKTICSKCKKHYCLECFQKYHKKCVL